MKKKSIMFTNTVVIILSYLLISCENGDNNAQQNGSSYRITITLNEVNENNDFVSVTTVGNNQSGVINYPIWKLNGFEQQNIQTVSLNKTNFSGNTKTYIIETVNPVQIFTSSFQVINYGTSLSGSLKIEKNEEVMVNEIINLVGDNTRFTKNYSFKN